MSYSHENAPMEQNYIGDYKLQQRWEWRGSGMACIRIRALGRRRGCPKIPAAFPIFLYDLQKRSNGPRRLVRSNGCKEWTDGRKIGERLRNMGHLISWHCRTRNNCPQAPPTMIDLPSVSGFEKKKPKVEGGFRLLHLNFVDSTASPDFVFSIPDSIFSVLHTRDRANRPPKMLEPKLLASSVVLSLLVGIGNFMYSHSLSVLSVSTSSLLFATQLPFTAFIIMHRNFTPSSTPSSHDAQLRPFADATNPFMPLLSPLAPSLLSSRATTC
ncbi:hypothetical protein ACLOJK_010016 [Asimina triloba]